MTVEKPRLTWKMFEVTREPEPLDPPPGGWVAPRRAEDHRWGLTPDDSGGHIACLDPCDPDSLDPARLPCVCQMDLGVEDFATPDPIPVRLVYVDESTPSGPWGSAEYGFYFEIRPV